METHCRGHEIYQWRTLLNFYAWKITVGAEFAQLEMAAHAMPVVGGLHGQMNVFAGLQLQDCEAAFVGDSENVDNAVLGARRIPACRRERN